MTEYAKNLIRKSEARKSSGALTLERLAEIRAMSGKASDKVSGASKTDPSYDRPFSGPWRMLALGLFKTVYDVKSLLDDYDVRKRDVLIREYYRLTSGDLVAISQFLVEERARAKRSVTEAEASLMRCRMRGYEDPYGCNRKTIDYWNEVIRLCDECSLRLHRIFDGNEIVDLHGCKFSADTSPSASRPGLLPAFVPENAKVPDVPAAPREPAPPADQDIIDFNENILTLGESK